MIPVALAERLRANLRSGRAVLEPRSLVRALHIDVMDAFGRF